MHPRVFTDDLCGTLRPWLLDHLTSFWRKHAVDPGGGFFDGLDGANQPIPGVRTTLVQARLTYVFSHAAILGDTASLAVAKHGFGFLTRACRNPKTGGWYRSVNPDGSVADPAMDAYDHAFVIFSMAWYFRASADPVAVELANSTAMFMDTYLSDSLHGGFQEEYLPGQTELKLPRRQNPHMHLLEAYLAMHEALFPDAGATSIWLERAGRMVALFQRFFFDRTTGSLGEYFDEKFNPAPGKRGDLREPGHHFEWVWLLWRYYALTKDASVIEPAQRLYAFGAAHGVDTAGKAPGIAFDGVDREGHLVAATKLLWPQTEYVKACTARWEWFGEEAALTEAALVMRRIRSHFLRNDGASWHNQLSRDGAPMQTTVPTRVLYHLFLGAAEMDRVMNLRPTRNHLTI